MRPFGRDIMDDMFKKIRTVGNRTLVAQFLLSFVLFMVSAIGFALIADEVKEQDTLRYDDAILTAINTQSSPLLDAFFVPVTNTGDVIIVSIATLLVAGSLLYLKKRYKALLVVVSVVGAAVINVVIKLLFERTRPDLWEQIVSEASFSFPSGHAMASSALGFALVAVMWNTRWRLLTILLAGLYIALVGLSRLYLGVHYPTDVIGGWLLSLTWVLLVAGILYVRIYRKRSGKQSNQKVS